MAGSCSSKAAAQGFSSVGSLTALSGVDLKLKSSGKDLAAIAPVIGEKLPATDEFEIQSRLTGSSEALTMKDARASARRGGLRFAVNGAVKDMLPLEGINVKVEASGKELAEIGPFGLLVPFVNLGALTEHPCDIQSIGQLGLQSPASK